jgi:carotenoid cleavage dioxygenase-like enzyme
METISNCISNDAPVKDELDVKNLKVIGDIPQDLTGIYLRNGPNPFFPASPYHFTFDGDGMIHAMYLAGGQAHYRNRYIQTKGLLRERKANKALYSSITNPKPMDPEWALPEDGPVAKKNSAAMNIISHAGKFLALSEGQPAYEINGQLNTVGEWTPDNKTHQLPVSAHAKRDPVNGELWFIHYGVSSPSLTIYCVNHHNMVTKQLDIEKPYSSMLHDFALTENYIVIFDCPVIFDMTRLLSGQSIIDWQPQLGTRIGIISRDGNEIRWFTTEPFFVFHFANAYEKDHEIIIDYVRHEHGDFFSKSANVDQSVSNLYRTIINLQSGSVKHILLNEQVVEFPRINENYITRTHQYIYANTMNSIIKLDVNTKNSYQYTFDHAVQLSEAFFVGCDNAQAEDHGYLLMFVYDDASKQSEFIILSAQGFDRAPLARIQMPQRIPRGFHGSWTPGALDW